MIISRRIALITVLIMIGCLLVPATEAAADEPCGAQVARAAADDQPVAGSRPVLFVHGIGSSHRAWTGTKLPKAAMKLNGVTAWTFDYQPASYEWVTDARIGPALAKAIGCLAKLTGRRVVVVAHSMGGLATQLAVSERSPDGLRVADHVAEVVTVGTPFRGSKLLTLLQKGRKNGRWTPGTRGLSMAIDALLSICAAKAKKNDNTCGILNDFESPVGQALQEDSKQIKALPRWPADLPVLPIGGDLQWGTGIKIWKVGLGPTYSLGDPMVALQSSTAHAVREDRRKLRCPMLKITMADRSECYHGKLPDSDDVRAAVIKVIKKFDRADSATIFYTRAGPGYRTDLYALFGQRSTRRLITDVRGLHSISPDGRYRAWTDFESGDAARLMISDLDGRNEREVATGVNGHGLCSYPAWAPDSRHLLFQTRFQTADVDAQWSSIDTTTGAKKTLAALGYACDPVWSPDGKSIAWQTLPSPGKSSIMITDATGRGGRTIPAIQGIQDPCGNRVVTLSSGGRYAVVDTSEPSQRGCGGVGRGTAGAGLVIDTRTGREVRTGLTGSIGAGTYLRDGSLLAHLVGASEFVLLDTDLRTAARFPAEGIADGAQVYAFIPN